MFKITASNSSAAEAQFLCRIQRKTSWVKADTQIGGTPFFSAALVDQHLQASTHRKEYARWRKSLSKDPVSTLTLTYPDCSNTYTLHFVSDTDVQSLERKMLLRQRLKDVQARIESSIPLALRQERDALMLELKNLV